MKLRHELVDTNGIRLNVAIGGEGRPVVLLHGFPDTHRVWRKQIDAFSAAGYQLIMPDMRGYGASDAPAETGAYRLETLSADVVGLLDAMDIERAYLIGHDWGSLVGWHVCMQAPQRVTRFAALSVGHPNAYAGAGIAQKLMAWYAALFRLSGIAETLVGAGNLMALKRHAADDAQLADWRANFAQPGRLTAALNYYRANRQLALAPGYPPVTVPVMGVWSEGDPALTQAQMKDSAQYVTGSFRYEQVEGKVGHWLQLTEPRRVNRLLADFGNGS